MFLLVICSTTLILISFLQENLPSGTTLVQPSITAPAVKLENCSHFSFLSKIENESQFEVPVVESHAVPNSPAKPSNWVTKKSEMETLVISDEHNQLNFSLDEDIITGSLRPKVIRTLSEDENSFIKPSSPLLPQNEQVVNVDSSEQNKTDFSINTPAMLREKNPEDGNKVIINDHATSAVISFQNSLWFELD